MNVIENETYHRLLLMYKGEMAPEAVLPVTATGEMSVTDATAAYGIGNWHWYNGRRAEAAGPVVDALARHPEQVGDLSHGGAAAIRERLARYSRRRI